jgi:hypothetical protein
MILTAIFLGLAIYITGDELSYYFKKTDYEKEPPITADYYYDQFERRDKRPEHAKETEEGTMPGGGPR